LKSWREHGRSASASIATLPGCRDTLRKFTHAIAASAFVSLGRSYSSQIHLTRLWHWRLPHILKMTGAFSVISHEKSWIASMRIDGEWLLCDDGVRRPIISVRPPHRR